MSSASSVQECDRLIAEAQQRISTRLSYIDQCESHWREMQSLLESIRDQQDPHSLHTKEIAQSAMNTAWRNIQQGRQGNDTDRRTMQTLEVQKVSLNSSYWPWS